MGADRKPISIPGRLAPGRRARHSSARGLGLHARVALARRGSRRVSVAARLLRAAGRTREAEAVEESRERYRRDFALALARTGRADIPPAWNGLGRDWGNLAVGYPCAALEPEDARIAALARRYWATAGG